MTRRLAIAVHGIVQGVGFRPFVYRTARARGLVGWVLNGADGVRIEVQGEKLQLEGFVETLRQLPPPGAVVERVEVREIEGAAAEDAFRIQESEAGAAALPVVPPDLGTCAECLQEVGTPGERRYAYPFTNCTACGPRFTIIERLPYDRPRTSMRSFTMCAACAAEYGEPSDRRFHAQPIACPDCGPALQALAPDGRLLGRREAALERAALEVREGRILALKGLGGFQLVVDATNAAAVVQLRERKHRPEKPFALMFTSLELLRICCRTSAAEERALASPEAPILLLRRRRSRVGLDVAAEVAPGNPWLGAMLPYTPMHHLLMQAIGRPVVCTSGNLAEEPMCIDTQEALERLGGVADLFLTHDRPVLHPVDDSLARHDGTDLVLLRRARGFAPRPIDLGVAGPVTLGFGGHQKSTVALRLGSKVVVSQHLGDLESAASVQLLERTVRDLVDFFAARPELLACDLHPDYASTRCAERLAEEWQVPLVRVQHHHAHVAACMAEHGIEGPVLGLAWDGSGHGTDRTAWGGEALRCDAVGFRRLAHLRPFGLPGGEHAVREPRRSALGLLYEMRGRRAAETARAWFAPTEIETLLRMLERGIGTPRTTSMGRLFDAVAALAGRRWRASFEGQAAMDLEFALDGEADGEAYPLPLGEGEPAVADWEPLVEALLADRERGVPPSRLAARFHGALLDLGVQIATRAGLRRVVLSGGCFQNAHLAARLPARLRAAGFEVYTHRLVPPNDGGLALGQVLVAAASLRGGEDVPRHSG